MTGKKHKCIIAQYFHSSSEIISASHCSEIDGLGDFAGYFKYCSVCGKKITAKMRKDFWKEPTDDEG